MTLKQLKQDGWIITDGSDSTLQLGKNINDTTWLYRQWTDKPWYTEEEILSSEGKLAQWDANEWDEAEININEYTPNEIEDNIYSYGYKISYSYRPKIGYEYIWVLDGAASDNDMSGSVMLCCECIFEQMSF